jgi:phosphohistidine phosphatase
VTHTIYLVRHGIAADAEPGERDADRALTAEGTHKLEQIGAGLKVLGAAPAVILASPLRRTRETADVLQAVLEAPLGVQLCTPLAPGHAAREVVAELRPYSNRGELMLVGHQPDMGELASHLLTGSPHHVPLPFRKGSVAAIVVGTLSANARGELLWFLTPKQLRAIGAGA